MAASALTEKERRVLDRFSKHGVEHVEASYASFGSENAAFNIQNPSIYRVRGTNSVLIFGDIKKSMSLEEVKRWLARHQDELRKEEHGHPREEHEENASAAPKRGGEQDAKINEEDVDLIMQQVKASREEVVNALIEADYDVVNALVNLSKNK